jgi:hypothetical protein
MDELRVPTVAVPAEVLCADGRRLTGTVFVPAAASHHDGPTRPEEWINDGRAFFALLPEGETTPMILNKVQLVTVTVPIWPDSDFHADVLRQVEIEAGGQSIVGTLHVDMPENQQRVLDYLNLAPAFVALYAGSRLHLVHKRHVARLMEGRS